MKDTKDKSTIEIPFLRTPYNYDRNLASDHHGLKCEDATLTQQQFRDECDINTIAEKYGLTGEMPTVTDPIYYGDFTGVFDYQTAMNQVVDAQRAFMTLPAKVRSRFDNDPQNLLTFLQDPENRREAEFLGILEPSKPAEPPPAPPPAAEAPKTPTNEPAAPPKGGPDKP